MYLAYQHFKTMDSSRKRKKLRNPDEFISPHLTNFTRAKQKKGDSQQVPDLLLEGYEEATWDLVYGYTKLTNVFVGLIKEYSHSLPLFLANRDALRQLFCHPGCDSMSSAMKIWFLNLIVESSWLSQDDLLLQYQSEFRRIFDWGSESLTRFRDDSRPYNLILQFPLQILGAALSSAEKILSDYDSGTSFYFYSRVALYDEVKTLDSFMLVCSHESVYLDALEPIVLCLALMVGKRATSMVECYFQQSSQSRANSLVNVYKLVNRLFLSAANR
jgi:hypothetical protein